MNTLIDKLELIKRERNIKNDAEFAKLIGITAVEYSRLKTGERPLTQRQAKKIAERFPELYGLVGSLLLSRPNHKRGRKSIDINP